MAVQLIRFFMRIFSHPLTSHPPSHKLSKMEADASLTCARVLEHMRSHTLPSAAGVQVDDGEWVCTALGEVMGGIKSIEDMRGVEERRGLISLEQFTFLIPSATKRACMVGGVSQFRSIKVTTTRAHAWPTTVDAMMRDAWIPPHPSTASTPTHIRLDALYKSEFGKKRSEGFTVEEGEGYGPR